MDTSTDSNATPMQIISNPSEFDRTSGSFVERFIFNHRIWVVLVCIAITAVLGYQLRLLHVNASYEKMLPQSHPYVRNYLQYRDQLRGLGNNVRLVVETKTGNIYERDYLDTLAKVNDALFLTTVSDRAWMKSLFSPAVRWSQVTENGFDGGPVMPNSYDGSTGSIAELRRNVGRANLVGNLVGTDQRSSMIVLPLLANDSVTGKPVDYAKLSGVLENVRASVEKDPRYRVHIIGFAKLVGDLIDGLRKVMTFFALAAVTAGVIIFCYTRCLRSTILVIACSLVSVVWQLGLVATLGKDLDPFSILVPFLVFAIGVSHGAQKMNGIMQDIGRGTHRWVAARYTFRRLFMAGLTALLADAVGFAVLSVIDIPVIRELAVAASMGVGVLIFTNLILLPVLLSYVGVSRTAARRSIRATEGNGASAPHSGIGGLFERFTERRYAIGAILVALVLAGLGFWKSLDVKIGDLDSGAPELRADSRYNRDDAYITAKYGISSDVFAVMVKTPIDGCRKFATLVEMDRLAQRLKQVPGVQQTASLVDVVQQFTMGAFEGNPKWLTIPRSEQVINDRINLAQNWNSEMLNNRCSLVPVLAYLSDHKAETLARVVKTTESFAAKHNDSDRRFLLAAGNAGVDAATNEVVERSNRTMLLYVYCTVILLCAITFRNWRAVLVAVLPLALTSIMAEALMTMLGIGVKVATLPVVALGVGIGVDYALYLLSVQLAHQRNGVPLRDAYRLALGFTGKVVALVGITLAAGVVTWAASPIKFQADMGIMLTFMFLWNMIGALVLIPALSHFLLRSVNVTRTRTRPRATRPIGSENMEL
jgi:predicted RND superfamily exporter protein